MPLNEIVVVLVIMLSGVLYHFQFPVLWVLDTLISLIIHVIQNFIPYSQALLTLMAASLTIKFSMFAHMSTLQAELEAKELELATESRNRAEAESHDDETIQYNFDLQDELTLVKIALYDTYEVNRKQQIQLIQIQDNTEEVETMTDECQRLTQKVARMEKNRSEDLTRAAKDAAKAVEVESERKASAKEATYATEISKQNATIKSLRREVGAANRTKEKLSKEVTDFQNHTQLQAEKVRSAEQAKKEAENARDWAMHEAAGAKATKAEMEKEIKAIQAGKAAMEKERDNAVDAQRRAEAKVDVATAEAQVAEANAKAAQASQAQAEKEAEAAKEAKKQAQENTKTAEAAKEAAEKKTKTVEAAKQAAEEKAKALEAEKKDLADDNLKKEQQIRTLKKELADKKMADAEEGGYATLGRDVAEIVSDTLPGDEAEIDVIFEVIKKWKADAEEGGYATLGRDVVEIVSDTLPGDNAGTNDILKVIKKWKKAFNGEAASESDQGDGGSDDGEAASENDHGDGGSDDEEGTDDAASNDGDAKMTT